MKNIFLYLTFMGFVVLNSCKSSKIDYSSVFWGELDGNQNYLYRHEDLLSETDGELNSGSIVLFGKDKGDFYEVYLNNSIAYSYFRSKSEKKKKMVKYYLYKPNYKKIGDYSSGYSQRLLNAEIANERSYQTGERGGCFYINSNGNRIYVDRSYCNKITPSISSSNTSKTKISTSSDGDIYVKGHYRKTKSGKTIYVKPHTRKN